MRLLILFLVWLQIELIIGSQLNPNLQRIQQTYNCNEVIPDDSGKIRLIRTESSTCLLPSTSSIANNYEQKSLDIDDLNINYFTIPNDEHENIKNTSYIDFRIRICSEPRGQVLVTDSGTNQTITAFVNHGTAYQCNHWLDDEMLRYMSGSNKIQVEYWSPYEDNYQVNFTFLHKNQTEQEGKRHIQYFYDKNLSENELMAFELYIEYREIPFKFEIEGNNITSTEYEPNSVKIFAFEQKNGPNPPEVYFGIVAKITHLDLDFAQGDYLIVGSGSSPSFRRNSKLQIITKEIDTQSDNNQRVWINASTAFLGIVTHNSIKPKTNALEFSWIINGTINITEESKMSDMLMDESIRLCFKNIDIVTWHNEVEKPFKLYFVHLANRFLFNDADLLTQLIDVSQIIVQPDSDLNSPDYPVTTINVAIARPNNMNYPLVPKGTVYRWFFESNSFFQINGTRFDVTDCEQSFSYLNIIIALLIILLLTAIILTIIWRIEMQNSVHENTLLKKNRKAYQQLSDSRQ